MTRQPTLVGIVPRKNLWDVIQNERWYHIPVESAPKNVALIEYLAFYFPRAFGEEYQYKVSYYADVLGVETKKRIELFPHEPEHKRAMKDYFVFRLGKIRELPKPIPSKNWRIIIHIPTSREKLFSAEEINDLWDTSPLEEKMYQEMKKRKIETERQLYVKVGGRFFCLDFGIFCKKGNIDLECDGEKYHILPDALTKDRERNNQLTSYGWQVLRFFGKEINHNLRDCLKIIERTINNLGGLTSLY
jgi:very-short-patch-repair endonuclease